MKQQVNVNSKHWLDPRPMRGEVWRVFDDTPLNGRWYVSNYGRVKRLLGGKEQHFRLHLSNTGYYRIRVGETQYAVHRLVALCFIKPTSRHKLRVDHRNGIKTDNRARNLHWVSDKGNQANPITKWDRDARLGKKPETERPEPIRTQIDLSYNPIVRVSVNRKQPLNVYLPI